jgi:hypothetical protein
MFFRFRSRFRRWLIAWAVLRIVCAATPVAAAVESSFPATGAPFLQNGMSGIAEVWTEVVPASQVGHEADRQLIVIGDAESNPLVAAWERHQSVRRDGNRVEAAMTGSVLARRPGAPNARTVALEGRGRALARASVGAPQAWLAAFVSPLDALRVVMMLGTSGGARVTRVTSGIVEPVTRPGVRGDDFLRTSTDSAFHVSGRPQVSDAPLGLLILVTGVGLLIMVLAAVAQVVHHCLRPAEAPM